MSTCKKIAEELGVSPSTVSRALCGNPRISVKTRERVARVAARMNYVPNQAARSLRTEISKTIGVLVPEVANSYWSRIIKGIEAEGNEQGYSILLGVSHADKARDQRLYPHIMSFLQHRVDGVIKLSHLGDYDGDVSKLLISRGTVLIDVDREGFDKVSNRTHITFNNKEGAHEATCHLLRLGHRHIAHVSGSLMNSSLARARYDGFMDAIRAAGISVPPEYIIEAPVFTFEEGLQAAERLLCLPNRPTAIFACSDYVAFAFMQVAHRLGISVPDDLSLIGFDDTKAASQMPVPLSSVRVPAMEAGKMAFNKVVAALENKENMPVKVELPTELVVRQSCAPRHNLY